MKTGMTPRPVPSPTGLDAALAPAGADAGAVAGAGSEGSHRRRSRSRAAAALISLFRMYQFARSGHVSPCRFTPTCSQYAIEAVDRHGAGRGVRLALRRLGRCRPGGPSGYDPIPE